MTEPRAGRSSAPTASSAGATWPHPGDLPGVNLIFDGLAATAAG